jgi:hypothetical protein
MSTKPKMIKNIKEHAQTLGIKDSVTQPLIDRLIQLNKLLRTPALDGSCRSQSEIEAVIEEELVSIKQDSYMNPLLTMPGLRLISEQIYQYLLDL